MPAFVSPVSPSWRDVLEYENEREKATAKSIAPLEQGAMSDTDLSYGMGLPRQSAAAAELARGNEDARGNDDARGNKEHGPGSFATLLADILNLRPLARSLGLLQAPNSAVPRPRSFRAEDATPSGSRVPAVLFCALVAEDRGALATFDARPDLCIGRKVALLQQPRGVAASTKT